MMDKSRVTNRLVVGLRSQFKVRRSPDTGTYVASYKSQVPFPGHPRPFSLPGTVTVSGSSARLLLLRCDAEVVRESMRRAGLVTEGDKTQPLKVHVTLMNTSHRKVPG